MITRDTSHLTIDAFQNVVAKKKCPLPRAGRYLLKEANSSRYLPRGSNGNVLTITTTGNPFVTREISLNISDNKFWIL